MNIDQVPGRYYEGIDDVGAHISVVYKDCIRPVIGYLHVCLLDSVLGADARRIQDLLCVEFETFERLMYS